jgi:hypothetical protein
MIRGEDKDKERGKRQAERMIMRTRRTETYLVKLLSSSSKNSFAVPSGPSSQVFSLTIIKDSSSLKAAFDRRRKSTSSEWDVWPDISSCYSFVHYVAYLDTTDTRHYLLASHYLLSGKVAACSLGLRLTHHKHPRRSFHPLRPHLTTRTHPG